MRSHLNLEFQQAELPEPPRPRGLGWLRAVGPGVIALGVSIGSGEFLLGPATFVQHGFSLLWVVLIAITFQTIFNTEVLRYTLATGEPVFAGFMRTRPSSTLWAWSTSSCISYRSAGRLGRRLRPLPSFISSRSGCRTRVMRP